MKADSTAFIMATIAPISYYPYLPPSLVHGQIVSVDIRTGSVAFSVDA